LLLAALASVGYGSSKGKLSGTVIYQGKPVRIGTITFLNDAKEALASSSITNGEYAMTNVPVGPVKIIVSITQNPARPLRPPKAFEATMSDGAKKANLEARQIALREMGSRPPASPLPPKSIGTDEPDLTYTVQPGSQTHNIELK
jgi:hypothetical protein